VKGPPSARKRQELGQRPLASVSWDQVRAFRLRRHHLDVRGARDSIPTIVGDMGGAQAQVFSAAELSIWARVNGLNKGEVENGLWSVRNLAKAWCMRRTMYILPSAELATFIRGSARRAGKEVRWALRHGISEKILDRILSATLSSLDEPITRTELAKRVSRKLRLPLRWETDGGWGSDRKVPCLSLGERYLPAGYLLHLLGARAVICSGPNDGGEATFVRADAWLPAWHDLPPDRAEDEILRRYLRSFGPATIQDFVAWTQMTLADARGIWARRAGELALVNVEGWPAWILHEDLPELEGARIDVSTVRLLPHFDSFLLGHTGRQHLLELERHKTVYRDQGWIAPTVLVGGRIAGVWEYHLERDRLTVRVEPFGRLPRNVASAIMTETAELGRFVGRSTVEVTFN
jgi:Winged helix DNA-binding domain